MQFRWNYKSISDEKIHIKGIFFWLIFKIKDLMQMNKKPLLNYNTLFPLKKFWKSIVIIYTHFFADPNNDFDEEEIKNQRRIYNSEIFENLMEK